MLTIRLGYTNYSKWAYQFRSVRKGYKLFDHFDGTLVCPHKFDIKTDIGVTKEITKTFQEWEQTDLALLSLLIATLTYNAIDHTLQKGTDSIDKFLSRLKSIRDQLITTGKAISDNDLIIAALACLPRYSRSSSQSYPNDGLSSATVGTIFPGSLHPNFMPSYPRPSNTQKNNFGGHQIGGKKEIFYRGKSKPHELFQIPVARPINSSVQISIVLAYLGQYIKSSLWHQSTALSESETSSLTTHGSATLPTLGQSSLLPIHHPTQLHVLLPISSSHILPINVITLHIWFFPELKSLQLDSESFTDIDEPKNFKIASSDNHWEQAMQKEYDSLQSQGTWILVPSPVNRSVVGCKWVYKLKKNSNGSIASYKARLVAQGFTHEHGIDYSETFSLVVRHSTVKLILALATKPWHSKFTGVLPSLGFVSSQSDTSLFVKHDDIHVVILLLYVDDIIMTGSYDTQVQQVIDSLAEIFELKDMGHLTYFLGLQIQYKQNGDLFVHQSKYTKELLKKAGMESCISLSNSTFYCSIVGVLQYLTFTRPDIAHSVSLVCQYMQNPTDLHMHLVKRIMRYLQGTLHCGLTYKATSDVSLSAYSLSLSLSLSLVLNCS
ncbi:7-deoxyloganetin glucosyltransferase-like [Pyrus ussuriensis x Pyrus communis]|uniref:7-deoxyloganetin glucosyltransferase-like n=1 Tax=Pyrus ussuriensis x Pyrus communis TaxID=2448454 RepID=A0A5N5GAW8_9ROSA|nr:7-deoxyloganetin glucosyltransferase-like [Pyrus ussuriensis x Pyrus communis]